MNNVKVTIGLCIKNAEATVKQAMESIILQDFPHNLMELIVVDGFSTDRSLSIVKDYLDKRVIPSKIFHENTGLGRARQIVVNNANGNYIVWVDGDMNLSRDFIRKQVDFMVQNPEVGIAKGQCRLAHGPNLLATLEIYSRAGAKHVDFNEEKAHLKSLGTSGCIYRVEAVSQAGGFDEEIIGYGEDWDAEYRVRKAGWKLCTTGAQYSDYERFGLTWKDLWQRYQWRGYTLHDVLKKHKGLTKLYRMLPPAAFLSGLFSSKDLYRIVRNKIVFLLPVQHMLKNVAWWTGYIRRLMENTD